MAFFLYRDGHEIKMAKGDYEIASRLHDEGYELFHRPLFTDQEAATEERAWQERLDNMREQGSITAIDRLRAPRTRPCPLA